MARVRLDRSTGTTCRPGRSSAPSWPPTRPAPRARYVDYIGVNRAARGRGVAKGLLHTVLADAAERGRDRVGLEVDADSPTSADGLYRSMGWATDYVTESWFQDVVAG